MISRTEKRRLQEIERQHRLDEMDRTLTANRKAEKSAEDDRWDSHSDGLERVIWENMKQGEIHTGKKKFVFSFPTLYHS